MAASPEVLAALPAEALPGVEDWSAFYDEYFDFVWRSLRRLGVPSALVDDAAQDVFVLAFRRQAGFEGRSSLKTWLFGIAWNRARELARGARRHPEEALSEAVPLASDANQEQAAMRGQAVRLLYRVLDELAPEARAVFVMAEVEEMTAPEIAEIVGIPLNTVYSRMRRARRDFEAAVKRIRARGGRSER